MRYGKHFDVHSNILSLFIIDIDELLSPGRGVWSNTVSIYYAQTYIEHNLLAMLSFIPVGSGNWQNGWYKPVGNVACDRLYSRRQSPDHPSSPSSRY